MDSRDGFYRAKAEECEARAREARDPDQRDQWLRMADDWRAMLRRDRPKADNDD